MKRHAEIHRETRETNIKVELTIDGKGKVKIETGIGFLDHMLTLFAAHGFFDLQISAKGDLHIDAHHTVEDIGICLGKAFSQALGQFKGIARYGFYLLPMEESLAQVALDMCKRPFLTFNAQFPSEKIGEFDAELLEEFLRAFAFNAGITLHVNVIYGRNSHHMAEAIFKGLGRAMDMATRFDTRLEGSTMSTKGVL